MLGDCRPHKGYCNFVLTELSSLAETRPDQIREYQQEISKMLILNLDPLIPVIAPLYPNCGRPAEMQVEIFRSCVLMKSLGIPLNLWVDKLALNPVLRIIAGFTTDNMPKTSSYYDFINRVVPSVETPVLRAFEPKPKKKLEKGEKLPPKNPGVTDKLVNLLINDEKRFLRLLSRRPAFRKFSPAFVSTLPLNSGSYPIPSPFPATALVWGRALRIMAKRSANAWKTASTNAHAPASFQTPTPIGAGTATTNVTSMATPGTLYPLATRT